MSNLSDKMSKVFKKDTPQGHAERCKQNNKSLAQAKKDFKKMFKEIKDV